MIPNASAAPKVIAQVQTHFSETADGRMNTVVEDVMDVPANTRDLGATIDAAIAGAQAITAQNPATPIAILQPATDVFLGVDAVISDEARGYLGMAPGMIPDVYSHVKAVDPAFIALVVGNQVNFADAVSAG